MHFARLSPVSTVIISISVMLFSGFLLTRVTKRLKLPNVTAYILAGILIGPFGLNLIPADIVEGSAFLADIALAFIAFSTGQFFKLSRLKKDVGRVILITTLEALAASLAVFVFTFVILHLSLAFSIVLSALASATAPASTMMTIRQTNAKGDFVDTLLQVVACDDVAALLAYSIAISIASSSLSGKAVSLISILLPLFKNLAVLLLGGLFGWLMKCFIQNRHSDDNRLIISIAQLFAFCGLCSALEISPLLGCMSMGTVYANVSEDDKLFNQLNYFSPPLLLLFFVRSGISFDLNALLRPSGSVGGVPLLVIGGGYFLARIIGKYLGAFAGCQLAGKPKTTRNVFGLGLIPQAGVAIGLAALGGRVLAGSMGDALETVILSSSVLYELIGPACAKFALYHSRSYAVSVKDLLSAEDAPEPSRVEILIERIRKLQMELEKEELSEEELAFNEAAEEQHDQLTPSL